MAIGKAGPKINLNKLSIKFGAITIVEGGKLDQSYDEKQTANYMKGENIETVSYTHLTLPTILLV